MTRHAHPTTTAPATIDRAGWRVREWCRAVGIARSTYYALVGGARPHAVHVGRMRIIVESPAGWLRRVGRDIAPETA